MFDSELEKLRDGKREYISIGISEGGEVYNMIPIPWESTAHAMNMRTPDVYFAPEDINDPLVAELLAEFKIIGCYIFTPLEDYSFLSHFPLIRDLSIARGENIGNLDFLRGLKECSMLYLEGARLRDLKVIATVKKENRSLIIGAFSCLSLCNCRIEDISDVTDGKVRFSELVIFGKGKDEEKQRWKQVNAMTYRYYSLDD